MLLLADVQGTCAGWVAARSGRAPPMPPRPAVGTRGRSGCRSAGGEISTVKVSWCPARCPGDSTARRHLAVHGQAPLASQLTVFTWPSAAPGWNWSHARRIGMGLEHACRLARLHQQGFVVVQFGERFNDLVMQSQYAARPMPPYTTSSLNFRQRPVQLFINMRNGASVNQLLAASALLRARHGSPNIASVRLVQESSDRFLPRFPTQRLPAS